MRAMLSRVLSAFFVLAGVSKLLVFFPVIERYYDWQMPGWWTVYVVGSLHFLGGLGLWSARTRRPAAFVLAVITLIVMSAQIRFAQWWDALASLALIGLLLVAAQAGVRSTETPPGA